MTIIDVRNVDFKYKDELVLKNITFHEDAPVITGLWGRNGAGKTTLMKLLSGQEREVSGNLSVLGAHPFNNSVITKNISYLREDHYFGKSWTVKDALHFASLFNENWKQEEADALIEQFKLPRKKKITSFSKGMHTMVQLVIGLASHSKVTIFDEPTNGLDAHARKQFFQALKDSYEKDPRYILISSHHINEIEPLCEKLMIISDHIVQFHEPIEYFQTQGVSMMGKIEDIESIVDPENILETTHMMGQSKVMVNVALTKELQAACEQNNIQLEKASMQDFLVNITS
ncbi:ABC-2 type transport system ATP-binding protein [Virgibacillus halotolerans]|uniref:ATP-binding cassette domain-containing protein n=1 Tax=Virgibacillus halotolerans TaxID=1071053 RepID=UPI00195FE28F|nr:ABC transporter ATP-binding protein [Virgibacillus halotolerans]MBM7599593.1 ABC-2 type transport system ATP-binding protein [Virgibacillus halotolerans]